MVINKDAPLYVKLAFRFLVIFFICYFINIAQNILIPFAFATLLAFLLLPIVDYLQNKNWGRILPILVALLCATLFISAIVYFLSNQIAGFIQDIPSIKQHLNEHFIALQRWVKNEFNVSFQVQNEYLNEQADKLRETGTVYVRRTFFSLTEIVFLFILLPIYTFLILYYRMHIRNFLYSVFKKEYGPAIQNVIMQSKLMIRSYMVGLVIEMAIVAVANSIGLMILGIQYALFFGVLAAVLNIIPYIGTFSATIFTILVTLTTSDSTSDLIWIVVIIYGIHIIDTNFLMPRIVASRLRINALISILGVLIGGALTGISGLFLSVPAIAFLKIICDQVPSLRPWGLLLGEDTSELNRKTIYQRIRALTTKNKSSITQNQA